MKSWTFLCVMFWAKHLSLVCMYLLKFDLKVPKMRQMKSKLIQYIQEKRLPINVAMFKTNVSPLVVPFLVTQNFCTSAKWALFWKVVFYIESETTLIWQLLPKKDKTQIWLPVHSHFPYQKGTRAAILCLQEPSAFFPFGTEQGRPAWKQFAINSLTIWQSFSIALIS